MGSRTAKFDAIGTRWLVEIYDEVKDAAWTELMQSLYIRIHSFDKTYSRFRTDSLVHAIAQKAGRYELPPDGYRLLNFYERIYTATSGKVTPLIGQTMTDAGYDATYSFEKKELTKPPLWESVLSYDKESINVAAPVLLDFGAAGKGYLVDIVAELMASFGLKNYLINGGGDILHRSTQQRMPEVGLENPLDTSEVIGTVKISNQSLCASAGSKRTWAGMHHIVDPMTLKSPENTIATWVIANDTMTADGLATALFFTRPLELEKQFTFSYALLDKNMRLSYSKNFPIKPFKAP